MHRWDRQLNADSSYVHSNTTLVKGENSIFVILQLKKRETPFSAPKKSLGPVTQWKHADPQTAPGIITCFSTLHQLIMVGKEKKRSIAITTKHKRFKSDWFQRTVTICPAWSLYCAKLWLPFPPSACCSWKSLVTYPVWWVEAVQSKLLPVTSFLLLSHQNPCNISQGCAGGMTAAG